MGFLGGAIQFIGHVLKPARVVVQGFLKQRHAFGVDTDDLKAEELLRHYRNWVYVASSKNAAAVASVPLRLFATTDQGQKQYTYLRKGIDTRRVSKEKLKYLHGIKHLAIRLTKAADIEEVVEHPFIDLWHKVNPFMNGFEMVEMLTLHQELTGDAYLYVWKNAMGVPQELWVLRPDLVKIVPSKENFIQGYLYGRTVHDSIAFKPEEIIHFKYPNPRDYFYGFSPLQAMIAAAVRQDDMNSYENSLLKNNARPDFVLQAKGRLNKDDIKRLREEFQQLYGKRRGRGKPAVLDQDLKIDTLGFSPREMAFLKGRKVTKEEIAGAYGVPMSKLTTEDVNLANAEVGERQYMKDTIFPRLVRTAQKLNEQLISMFDRRLIVAFDNPVPEDREFKLKKEEQELNTWKKSINQVREEQGEEPVPWGDVPLVPITTVPLGSVQPAPQARQNERAVAVAEKVVEWDYSSGHSCSHYGKAQRVAPPQHELARMIKIMRGIYADMEKEVLAKLRSFGKGEGRVDWFMFGTGEWVKETEERMGAIIRRQLARGGQIGLDQIRSGLAFDLINPEVQAFLQRYVAHFSAITTRRRASEWAAELLRGLDAGESIPDLTKRAQTFFKGMKRFKAEQVARSEASRAVHAGIVEGWKQSGVVEAEIWDAQTDACPWCVEMDGKIVSLGNNFFDLGENLTVEGRGTLQFNYEAVAYPPLHPNCVCTVRAVIKEEGE